MVFTEIKAYYIYSFDKGSELMRDFGVYFNFLRSKEEEKIKEGEARIESINVAEERYNLAVERDDKLEAKRAIEGLLARNSGSLSPIVFFKSLINQGEIGRDEKEVESEVLDSSRLRGEIETLEKVTERVGALGSNSPRVRDKKISSFTWSTSSILATLGVFLLAAGLSVFTAVKWSSLSGVGQLSIIIILNILSFLGTRFFYKRDNYVIAETLSWLTASVSGITMLAAIRFNLVGNFSIKTTFIFVFLTVGLSATIMALLVVKKLRSPYQQSIFAYCFATHFLILQFKSELKPIIYILIAILMIRLLSSIKIKKYGLLASQFYIAIGFFYLFSNGFNSFYTTAVSITSVLILYFFGKYYRKFESLAINSGKSVRFDISVSNLFYGFSGLAFILTLFSLLANNENISSSILIHTTALYLIYGVVKDNLISLNIKNEVSSPVGLFVISFVAMSTSIPSIVNLKIGVSNLLLFLLTQLIIVLFVVKSKKYFYLYIPLIAIVTTSIYSINYVNREMVEVSYLSFLILGSSVLLMMFSTSEFVKKALIEREGFVNSLSIKGFIDYKGFYNTFILITLFYLVVSLYNYLTNYANVSNSVIVYANGLVIFYMLVKKDLISLTTSADLSPKILLSLVSIASLIFPTFTMVNPDSYMGNENLYKSNVMFFLLLQVILLVSFIKLKKYIFSGLFLLLSTITSIYLEINSEILLFSVASLIVLITAAFLSKLYIDKVFIFFILYATYSSYYLLSKISIDSNFKTFFIINILLILLYISQKLYRGNLIIVKSSLIITSVLSFLFFADNFWSILEAYDSKSVGIHNLIIPQIAISLYITAGALFFRRLFPYKNIVSLYGVVFLTISLIFSLVLLDSQLGANIISERYTTEFYTLPVFMLWFILALYGLKKTRLGSFALFTPALVILLIPSSLLNIVYNDVLRFIFLILLSVFLVLFGSKKALQAPILYGGFSTFIAAVSQLLPYVNGLPRWLSLTLLGFILLFAGIRAESLKIRGAGLKYKVSELR